MQLCKLVGPNQTERVGIVEGEHVVMLAEEAGSLADILAAADLGDVTELAGVVERFRADSIPCALAQWLPPIDQQEVWAAGVTYKRSQAARMEESVSAASFYDKVYTAPRPELFFKATPHRVAGPGQPLRVRADTQWCVPEPELTLVITPSLKIVGFTIGNDMSARDIEGENPLYLPQAKTYRQCAGLGPVITLAHSMPPLDEVVISLVIGRAQREVFRGETSFANFHRKPEELVSWLGRDQDFPRGVFLMTGTGIVPPNDFTLQPGDIVNISITGIGTLSNPIVQG